MEGFLMAIAAGVIFGVAIEGWRRLTRKKDTDDN